MRGGLDRPFSHVPLPSSIGARSRPGHAPVSFSGDDDDDEDNALGGYESMEARMVVEAEEDEGGGGPAAVSIPIATELNSPQLATHLLE
jgi:hypothetical protein